LWDGIQSFFLCAPVVGSFPEISYFGYFGIGDAIVFSPDVGGGVMGETGKFQLLLEEVEFFLRDVDL
jgi:hypothetical protein